MGKDPCLTPVDLHNLRRRSRGGLWMLRSSQSSSCWSRMPIGVPQPLTASKPGSAA